MVFSSATDTLYIRTLCRTFDSLNLRFFLFILSILVYVRAATAPLRQETGVQRESVYKYVFIQGLLYTVLIKIKVLLVVVALEL